MLLAIDAGNTNIVFAVIDGAGAVRAQWRAATDARRTADEFAVWLLKLMELQGIAAHDISGAIVGSVVPAVQHALRTLCRTYFGQTPLEVGAPGVRLGIDVRVDRPDEVGADRLLNAVAVGARHRKAAIVVDFGTATTFDVVEADGAYLGGVIAPGLNLSLDALQRAAAKLPEVAIRRPETVIGRSTVAAMRSGVFWGYVGLIEGLIARIRAEHGRPLGVMATGGLAPLLAEATPSIESVDPDLTLHGLAVVYQRNAKP